MIIWILVAFGTAIAALLYIGYILRVFYVDTTSLAPGTVIRPMGVTFHLGVTWMASILFDGFCALVGGILSLKQKRWWLVGFALVALIAVWLPLPVSDWGYNHIVTVRKLVLDD